jgi:hypothetical protein
LALARIGWVTLAALLIAFFLANLPAYFAQLLIVCLHAPCARWQLTPASVQALGQFHISPGLYTLASLLICVASFLVWFAVAALIAWRQSRRWLALLTSLLLLAGGITNMSGTTVAPLYYGAPIGQLATLAVSILWFTLFLLVFALFPTGRFTPGWMRWGMVMMPAVLWAYTSVVPWSESPKLGLNPLSTGLLAGVIASIIGAQIYRFRRVSTSVERQQTKWVLVSLIGFLPPTALYYLLPEVFPALGQPDSLYFLWAKWAYTALWMFIPACFGIAILRYRLFEIDRIINRALVYGALTAILVGVYIGIVIGLQSVFRATTGQESPIAVVASTLFIAALFQPLRGFLQRSIDRRFYRARYDVQKALAAFNTTLRQEVSLSELQERLVWIVNETMRPTHVSLWITSRPTEKPDMPNAVSNRGEPSQ